MRSFLAIAASVGLLSAGCWGGDEKTGASTSVAYVVRQLRNAGYEPHLQRFRYTDTRELERPELERTAPNPTTYTYGDDFVSLRYSGSGDVAARMQPVDAESQTS